ncbi:MAG TPA: hypothetical protein VM686_15730 [Polyangiaceae bacterium]|nr:hypothetical protein [Polyangiaceae bacterium]
MALLAACGGPSERSPTLPWGPPATTAGPGGPCASPNTGCTCNDEQAQVDCGRVRETHGDYVTCSMGTRTCESGRWSECQGDRITLKSVAPRPASGLRPLTLGTSAPCAAGFDACDPYCNLIEDEPDAELDLPDGFEADDDGLTIVETGTGSCTSLTLTPDVAGVTVTDFSPLTAVNSDDTSQTIDSIGFTLEASPAGCAAEPFATTWTIDKVDRAAITGTTSADGDLTLALPLAGTITVTAYAAGLSDSAELTVKVNVLETSSSDVAPNTAAVSSHGHVSAFGAWNSPAAGTIASSAYWLYPYQDTYFPLGLPAPVVQFWCTPAGTTSACRTTANSSSVSRAVKLSLRWPTSSSSNPSASNTSDFNYSIIVDERNTVSDNAASPVTVSSTAWDPQVVSPEDVWDYFEQTARGDDADLVIQRRYRSSTTSVLEQESRRPIHFVDGQLKGTVYYNSYSSPQGGNTGAVLAIAPGADEPVVAVQPSGRCTVCHTVNVDGTRLIANGSSNATFNSSRRYDISDPDDFDSPPVLNSYDRSSSTDTENVGGDRFTFGAPFLDGRLYMTHGGSNSGDNNWRAPPDASKFYDVTNPGTALSVTNWHSNVYAATPRFSSDGTKLAFGFWSGTSLAQSPSGTLAPSTTRLAAVDFGCSSPPCSSTSSGWNVSNARNLTPAVSTGLNANSNHVKVARPTFTPSGDAVIYQAQYRTSRSSSSGGVLSSAWSPSDINSVGGALAELWMSNVPVNAGSAASPTRLLKLNGLDANGNAYLPETSQRAQSALSGDNAKYHRNSAQNFGITQADNCGNTGTATSVVDYRLNYLPSIAPSEAGGMVWVIFTSRRMYGNVAYNDPWDAEPCNPNAGIPTSCSANSCYSGAVPTKKLWVAAIDKNWTPGTDPSHPAFYLPGQELEAGNSDGYWVSEPCAAVGQSCETSDDCCDGSGSAATTGCKVTDVSSVPPSSQCAEKDSCSEVDQACDTSDDCCEGLTCPDGGGVCVNTDHTVYESQVYERVYEADCPIDTLPEWRFFEWRATTPQGTSIEFTAQTSADAENYEPAAPATIGTADESTPPGVWHRGATPVQEVLLAQNPVVKSQHYLKVTMTFNPDHDGKVAPKLHKWRQIVDCVPSL